MRRHTRRLTLRTGATALTAVAAFSLAGYSASADTVGRVKDSSFAGVVTTTVKSGTAQKPVRKQTAVKKAVKRVTCTVANSKIRMSKPARPINHLLLTLTNESGKPCDAYYAPLAGFNGDQAAMRWIEESQPQAVVTVPAGGHAYASVLLSGDGDHGHKAKELRLEMANSKGIAAGGLATTAVPGGSVYVDDDRAVSYWQSTMADALVW